MCALPTAQLGQLGNMSMPYSIPTYDVGPPLWQKVLGAILTNAAGTAARTAATNLMTRDNAAEFGQKNASGFGRLLGPNVSDAEARQLREQKFTAGESAASRKAEQSMLDQRLLAQAGQSDAEAANARLLQDDRARSQLDEQYLQDKNMQLRLGQEGAMAQTLARLKAELEANNPETKARASLLGAQEREANTKADFTSQILKNVGRSASGQPSPTGAVSSHVTPAMREEAAFNALPPEERLARVIAQQTGGASQTPSADPVQALRSLMDSQYNAAEAPETSTSAVPQVDPRILQWLATIRAGGVQ